LCRWEMYAEGMSYNLNIKDLSAIPAEIRFSFSKASQFKYLREIALAELKLRGLTVSEHWKSLEAMKEVSWFKKSPFTMYVSEHWKDDDFFGYQFLNGINPYVIKRCTKLPSNFAVTEEMVKPFLANGNSLTAEMKKGNIFISDYKIMEGLQTHIIDGKPVPLSAALCLLYLNPEKKLLPIAIQLTQQPSKETLIFLPSDLDTDWLLAKIFVRHADSLYAQVINHLQKTHLLAESFAMATLYALYFVCFWGLSQSTYASLCPHEDIAARGLESIPNFYYRDDALRLWNIINSFVRAVVAYYYPSDSEVSADPELQEWINEIFYYGFLGNSDSGIPSSFQTVEELIKFVTMVIFTSSCRHSAVNGAQFDFQGWIPNAPVFLHHGPPTTKGQSSTQAILVTLPNKALAAAALTFWFCLCQVPLGTYPEQRFDEPAVLQMIKDFQAELSSLSVAITKRNSELELPYNYLNPEVIENSVAI
uniref:Lipoxygenase domain-containing protein n=1 Tax=Lates calcarifer TaxID=8187 RepID=A0A4W6CVB8_LATCA